MSNETTEPTTRTPRELEPMICETSCRCYGGSSKNPQCQKNHPPFRAPLREPCPYKLKRYECAQSSPKREPTAEEEWYQNLSPQEKMELRLGSSQ